MQGDSSSGYFGQGRKKPGYTNSSFNFGHFQTNDRVKEVQVHAEKVHSVDWNCDGRRLGSGSSDKTACILTLDRDKLSKEVVFRGHQDGVDQLCWHKSHPDLLSTASSDKSVRIWDARLQKSIATIPTKGENLNLSWSPDGQTIAVGNKEDLVSFIDTKTFKVKHEEQFKFEVNEISWNNTSDLFFLTSGLGSIHILSYPNLQTIHVIQAHPANCICIKFDPSGKYFATGSADAVVSLWQVEDLVCVRTYSSLDWPVRTLCFSHDGKLLASASEDLVINVSSVDNGEKVLDIPVEQPTFTVSWHPKRYLLAFACDDKDKYERDRDAGTLKVFGFSSE